LLDTHLMTEGVFEPVLVAEICEPHRFTLIGAMLSVGFRSAYMHHCGLV
jgi:hypothetical protein